MSIFSRIRDYWRGEPWNPKGFTPAQRSWIDRMDAEHKAVFDAQVSMLDEDLRPPVPSVEEDLCNDPTPWTLNLDMGERLQLQILREVQKLSKDGPQQVGNAKRASRPSSNLRESPLSAAQLGKGHAVVGISGGLLADDGVELPVALPPEHEEKLVAGGTHAPSSASGGEAVNGGGKA